MLSERAEFFLLRAAVRRIAQSAAVIVIVSTFSKGAGKKSPFVVDLKPL